MWGSRKNPFPPHGRSPEIPRGRGGGGGLKAKISEAKYEAKLEFPGGEGGAIQNTFHGGYLLEQHNSILTMSNNNNNYFVCYVLQPFLYTNSIAMNQKNSPVPLCA